MAKNRGNKTWIKGGPSPNPLGRGVAKASTSEPPGSDGVSSRGGLVSSPGESNNRLTGRRRWLTFANSYNVSIVATGLRYFRNLIAGTEWHAEANELGGADGIKGAEICRVGLLESPMSKPWSQIVSKAAMYKWLGFSLHACGYARRNDGTIIYSDIAHRPQHTIAAWYRPDDQEPWWSVTQQTDSGEYEIDLDDCFYLVDDALSDGPEGTGLLRHIVELVRRLEVFEKLEGSAFISDMGGMPIGRAPIGELFESLTGTDEEKEAKLGVATQAITDAISRRIKTPDVMQWLLLDSATFDNNVQKWGVDIVRTETNGLAEINAVIGRLNLEIARVLGIEFALVGGGDSAGTYGMHADKTTMFGATIENTLLEIGAAATRQLARRLVARNGLDPNTCTPKLVAEPISTDAILTVTQALAQMSAAGLAPDDPARNVLRKRMRLPPEPERDEELMLPRKPVTDLPPDDSVDDEKTDAHGEAA